MYLCAIPRNLDLAITVKRVPQSTGRAEGDLCRRDPADLELFRFGGVARLLTAGIWNLTTGALRLPEDGPPRGVVGDAAFGCGGRCRRGNGSRRLVTLAVQVLLLQGRAGRFWRRCWAGNMDDG